MMEKSFDTIPVGRLGLVPVEGCRPLMEKVDKYLVSWRKVSKNSERNTMAFNGYNRDTYIIDAQTPRFGSGEAKGSLQQSVRGDDLFIMVDVCNYSLTYSQGGLVNHLSPDDHFANLKRVIAAANGKARRITVIMPFLYESRQVKRDGRESMDCALALHELVAMGVDNILTFDAHEPRIQNAIPLTGFETIQPTYQFIKAILSVDDGLTIDSEHMMVISPDEGAMSRAVFYANMLGLDVGMFYKRRDYTRMVNGINPIVAHEFLGADVSGKDVVVIDDMISSGDRMTDVVRELKRRGARKVFACATFGLFTNGLEKFDRLYEQGVVDKVFTTNVIYQRPDLLERPWYKSVEMGKYLALLIDTLNHDESISELLNPIEKIHRLVENYMKQ